MSALNRNSKPYFFPWTGQTASEVMEMESSELPLGMGMALAQNISAMERFASMSEAEKQAVIDGAHGVQSKAEMQAYLQRTLGAQ